MKKPTKSAHEHKILSKSSDKKQKFVQGVLSPVGSLPTKIPAKRTIEPYLDAEIRLPKQVYKEKRDKGSGGNFNTFGEQVPGTSPYDRSNVSSSNETVKR